MSNKTVFVPVDPEGFGCGLLLGLIIRYWRELLIGGILIFVFVAGASIVQLISTSISTANETIAATEQSKIRVIEENKQADELVKNQEYYLAASIARTILSEDPNNDQAKKMLQTISGYVSGGLAVGSGVYYPFNSAESITFVSGLNGDLVRVSPDGQRGLIVNGENNNNSVINFSDGSFVKIDDGIPSTDLTRVELLDMTSGIYFTPTKIKNIYDGNIQQIDCSAYTSSDTWSQNSRFIISGNQIVDTQSGSCRDINIPGLSGTVLVDEEKMWIVLWGDFTSMEQGQLFTANIDGSGLKKLTDLPIHGRDWHDSRTFLAPDSSAIYLSEGLLVSTRTGQIVNAIPNAIGWLESDPITSNLKQAPVEPAATQAPAAIEAPIELAPTEAPLATETPVPSDVLPFVYPVDGQTLDYGGSYLFKVTPIEGADGYLWGFFQDGNMVWENMRDEGILSDTEYGIFEGSLAHSKFAPGYVEVWVRASINGAWTEPIVITIYLQP